MNKPLIPINGKLTPNTDYVPKKALPPNKVTEAVVSKIIQGLKLGMSKKNAALSAGISYTTLFNWLKKGEALEEEDGRGYFTLTSRINAAIGACEAQHLQVINNAAIEDGTWQASAWLLERRFKDWNKKSQVEHNATLTLESLLSHGGQDSSNLSLNNDAVDVEYLDISNGEDSGTDREDIEEFYGGEDD